MTSANVNLAESVAERMLQEASSAAVPITIIGGIGCWLRIRGRGSGTERFRRDYGDVDIIIPRRARSKTIDMFTAANFRPNTGFNAVQGAQRLIFASPEGCKIDVFVGEFAMAHRIPFGEDAFAEAPAAAPATELLLTKLQLHAATEKDIADVAGILAFCSLGGGADQVDPGRFAAPLGTDWGLWRTVTANLQTVAEWAAAHTDNDLDSVVQRCGSLLVTADRVPKSLRWKARARIGDRLVWYESPEEPETEATAVR